LESNLVHAPSLVLGEKRGVMLARPENQKAFGEVQNKPNIT
jgi:hypothetical protein